jgi:aminotransferase EvaB
MIQSWSYKEEFEIEKAEIFEAIESVFNSGRLILGPYVEQFEREMSSYCGSKFGVGVNSGTDAIFLGLKALGVGPGDEVITVPNTAVPTVSAITTTGARAVFVDIEEGTYLMNTEALEEAITSKTKAVVPVHLYGQCVEMDTVMQIARRNSLSVLEDSAQAQGALYKGKKAGSMSDVSAFSFYPTKILGTYGDGGMCVTADSDIAARIRRLRFYGMDKTYYSLEEGFNSRLDELHAAILLKKLKHIETYIARRRELARRYDQALKNTGLILPIEKQNSMHVYHLYVVRHPGRDKIIEELKKKDIMVNIHYPWPVHIMEGFSQLGYKKGSFPITEKLASEIFSLPIYPYLPHEKQDMVIEVLKNICSHL